MTQYCNRLIWFTVFSFSCIDIDVHIPYIFYSVSINQLKSKTSFRFFDVTSLCKCYKYRCRAPIIKSNTNKP